MLVLTVTHSNARCIEDIFALPHNSQIMAVRMVGHFRPPKLRGNVAKAMPAPLSAAALAGDLLPEETNEVVALPPCFFARSIRRQAVFRGRTL